jgi:L-asparaginase
MLQLGRSRLSVDINTLMLIDSLEMDRSHREKILAVCTKTTAEKIVITHGTDTMVDTATFLAKENLQKTIVLTGAMIPYQFGSSDGLFNLGSSLAFVQTLPLGVYISINGKYFSWNNVQKNTNIGEFENLSENETP